jgi:hypothetical protein
MKNIRIWLITGVLVLGLMNSLAMAQTLVKVRGTITDFDGHALEIKTRDGKNLKAWVTDDTSVNSLYALQMSDIKQGRFVGVTAVKRSPPDRLFALEVHVFPESSRGMGEGHRDWDLEPGSTMTNANIDSIVDDNDGKELTLGYKGGTQKIIVPPDTPVVTFTPGDKSLLKSGAQVFVMVQKAADGTLTAQRIQVGKDGMKPPM